MASEKVLIATRVAPEMREGFKHLSMREKRSMSSHLQMIVEREVRKFEKEVVKAA